MNRRRPFAGSEPDISLALAFRSLLASKPGEFAERTRIAIPAKIDSAMNIEKNHFRPVL
jgi:hypothetical protein